MRRFVALALAALISVAAACGGDSESEGAGDQGSDGHDHSHEEAASFREDEADTRTELTLKDFEFVGVPPSVKGPKAYFTLVNVGAVQHELMILSADGKVVAAAPPFPGGGNKSLAAELPPGTYTLECRLKEGNKTHVDLGMKSTLTVT